MTISLITTIFTVPLKANAQFGRILINEYMPWPGNACASSALDFMGIEYKSNGESTGRGNSIARKPDEDCGWVKDIQQCDSETNNTPGERYSFTMSKYITEDHYRAGGTARFVVDPNPASTWFPVDCIVGFDAYGDSQFTVSDTYTTTSRRENVEIQVFNPAGQEMYHHKYTVSQKTNPLELPAEKLQSGLYFAKT